MKLLIREVGSDQMLQFWLTADDRSKVISAVSQVEARSAVCRLRREQRMDADEAAVALDAIYAEMRRLIEQPVNPPVIEAANSLGERYVLRALDAVQLGSAVIVRDLMSAADMRFIASDHALLHAASEEGFDTWDPTADP